MYGVALSKGKMGSVLPLQGVIELLLSVDVEIKWEDIVEGGAVEGATAEEVAGEWVRNGEGCMGHHAEEAAGALM